jgi:anti-anti-sigma factor
MTRLVYISSAGVRVIFKVRRSLEERKGTFLMSNVQPQIEKVFAIVNALPRESIFKDMNEVDAYLDVMQKKELEKQQST